MIVTSERIPHARIITPSTTYVKHAFTLDDGVAEVRRNGAALATLTDTEVTFTTVHRVEGTNPDGEREVWKVDNLGCGCRNVPQVFATDERDRPT